MGWGRACSSAALSSHYAGSMLSVFQIMQVMARSSCKRALEQRAFRVPSQSRMRKQTACWQRQQGVVPASWSQEQQISQQHTLK